MGLAKQAVLLLFFGLFVATLISTWRRSDCEEQRLLPLKEYHHDSQA
jgi:hypothetical protein